jgi:type IV pilus biogenesis protein CpaD/CtpE
MTKTKYLMNFLGASLFLTGCEKQYLPNDGYIPEIIKINAREIKKVYFFGCSSDFNMDPGPLQAVDQLLKDVHDEDASNIGFMLISNQSISAETQEKVRKQLYEVLHKHGFINSRIINGGTCVYEDAKTGVRIDILKYKTEEPDCSKWSEYIGDTDTNKNLPKYGASDTYNIIEMIANKADFVAPRKYKGPEAKSSIAATTGTNSGGAR